MLASVPYSAKNPRVARIGASLICLLMVGQMGPKAIKEPKWHTVTIAATSLIVLGLLVSAHFTAMKARKSAAEG